MGCSLPHYSIHGLFQARVLGWVAIYFNLKEERIKKRSRQGKAAS